MWKRVLLVTALVLPLHVNAACTFGNLKGSYVAMLGGEFSGLWQRCTLKLDASGRATGRCLDSTGITGPADPIQFSIRGNCAISGRSDNGAFSYFLRLEKHKRGATGRFEFDDGNDFFEGPVVAVKRGK